MSLENNCLSELILSATVMKNENKPVIQEYLKNRNELNTLANRVNTL